MSQRYEIQLQFTCKNARPKPNQKQINPKPTHNSAIKE